MKGAKDCSFSDYAPSAVGSETEIMVRAISVMIPVFTRMQLIDPRLLSGSGKSGRILMGCFRQTKGNKTVDLGRAVMNQVLPTDSSVEPRA